MAIITDPLFYALAIPAVVVLGLSKGGFSGVGQMALPIMALALPPLEAAAIMLPIMIVQDLAALWVYRKDWNGRILAVMIPGSLIGVCAAWALAAHVSDAAVRIFIAVFTLAFVTYNWIGPARVAREAGSASVPGGVFWGALSGFTSTICQAGAPPYQMYVLSQNLAKMTFVGTTALYFAFTNLLKVPSYFALGSLTWDNVSVGLALTPLAFLTNLLGVVLVRRVSMETFYKIAYVLIVLIALELLRGTVMAALL